MDTFSPRVAQLRMPAGNSISVKLKSILLVLAIQTAAGMDHPFYDSLLEEHLVKAGKIRMREFT